MIKNFRLRRSRRAARRPASPGALPGLRVALLDERLRWVSLDGLVLDLSVPDGPGSPGSRLAARDAERATELIGTAHAAPVVRTLTTGDGRDLELHAAPIAAAGGQPLIVGIAHDVTDRRAAQREIDTATTELVLSEQSFRAAFDDAPGPVAMIAGQGESDGRFLRVNQAFADLLGTTVQDLEFREVASVTHPDDRALEATTVQPDGTRAVRKRYLHATGRPIHVEVRVSAVRDDIGTTSYYVNHVLDIDSAEATERALRSVSQIRHDMVSTISHELRTPLTNVQGYLEMIAGEDFGELTAEQKSMIDIAMRNASRLEEFVADLLMLARLDAAELDPIRHVPLDLAALVDAAVSESAPADSARRHDLVVELPPHPVTVRGDAAHLKRALQSLLANAIKYTPEGGRIAVSVSTTPDSVDVAVLDSGIGVDPEEIALLGTRFYRGADPHRRAIGGTGLGLAITRTIVERHHGRLRISSTPGEGSRFVISLPTG